MIELLIPALVFLSVIGLGGAALLVRAHRQQMLRARLEPSFSADGSSALLSDRSAWIELVQRIGRAVSSPNVVMELRERLNQAGFYDAAAPTVYLGVQMLLALSAIGLLAPACILRPGWSLTAKLGCVLGAAIVCALLPALIVSARRRQRQAEIRRQLPDAIDLLEICVSAGMGLDMAWNAVADEFRTVSPVLADEMSLVNLEIHLGGSRAEAMRHMAHRTRVEDISSLVAALVQSERFGTSVAQALRTYADAMRQERSQRAEEAAEKLMVKLLFPMILFIFPNLFVVILGPAVLRIAGLFRSG